MIFPAAESTATTLSTKRAAAIGQIARAALHCKGTEGSEPQRTDSCWSLLGAAPAHADDSRLGWPLRPPPAVVRQFDAASPNWNPGHRGVDLAGRPGQPVYAAGSATVVFAGLLAGRPVVSLAHPGGLRTSYEPVVAQVRVVSRCRRPP